MSAAADGAAAGAGEARGGAVGAGGALGASRSAGGQARGGSGRPGVTGWRRLNVLRRIGYDESAATLGDFTTTWRVIPLAVIAIGLGVLSAFLAKALLWLIAAFTNLFFYQRLSAAPVSPAEHHLGLFVVLV